nr:MAG TPA: hypothetical protein [Bacteriophage sp.]
MIITIVSAKFYAFICIKFICVANIVDKISTTKQRLMFYLPKTLFNY